MDLDASDYARVTSLSSTLKLESVDGPLSGPDVSFDTSASDDGKIRVHMHSEGAGVDPTVITTTIAPMDVLHTTALPQSVLDDPFLGETSASAIAFGASSASAAWYDDSGFTTTATAATPGRVRIPLSWTSGEVREWEVRLC